MPDDVSENRKYALPHIDNRLQKDVGRIIAALQSIDVDIHQLRSLLGVKGNPKQVDLTGAPTANTPQLSESSSRLATTAYVKALILQLIDYAPENLDTLRKIAKALGDDPDFVTTTFNAIDHQKSIFHGFRVVNGHLVYTRLADSAAAKDYTESAIASGGLAFNIDSQGHLVVEDA